MVNPMASNKKITVLHGTTVHPITRMGERAGCCWNAPTDDPEKNYQRGLDCLNANHGRVLEFVNVELLIEGYSAKVIREWYTHIGGSPTRLQESTRRVDYRDFSYVTPASILQNQPAREIWENTMREIRKACMLMEFYDVPREDASMILPLAMSTRIVDKRNLRNLIDMSKNRMCATAYWEYRELFRDICNALRDLSDEWAYIIDHFMHPKCEDLGYCPEKNGCGRKPAKNAEVRA